MSAGTKILIAALAGALALGALLVALRSDARRGPEPPSAALAGEAPLAAAPSTALPTPAPAAVSAAPAPHQRTALAADRPAEARAEAKPEPPYSGPHLTGVVLDANGFPIPDARVEINAEGTRSGLFGIVRGALSEETRSAADGGFRVPRRQHQGQEVSVSIHARGYLPLQTARVPDAEEGPADLGTFELLQGAVISGHVLDARARPVAGATLHRTTPDEEASAGMMFRFQARFDSDGPDWCETDGEGAFAFEHAPIGPFVLQVAHPDHPEGRAEGETRSPGEELAGIVVRLAPTGTIRGALSAFPGSSKTIVVRARPHRPGPEEAEMGALALLADGIDVGNARVEPDGSFEVTGLELGVDYELEAQQLGGFFGGTPCSDRAVAQAGTEGVELHWKPASSLRVRVLDAETNAPVHDLTARYAWRSEERSGMSFATQNPRKESFDGPDVRLIDLRPHPAPGTLELLLESPGYLSQRLADVVVPAGEEVELAAVRLRRAPRMRVRVLDALTGEPLRRARVALEPEESDDGLDADFALEAAAEHGRTDASGWCELAMPAGRTATLDVWKPGYVRESREAVPLSSAGAREETVRMTPGGSVRVEVVDSSGAAAGDARVHYEDPEGMEHLESTNGVGRLRLRDLRPGEYRFRAARAVATETGSVRISVDDDEEARAEGRHEWVTVGVVPRETTTALLRVPAAAWLDGEVLAAGAGVGDARVSLHADRDLSADEELNLELAGAYGNRSGLRTRTDRGGRFRLEEVPVGPHRLRVQTRNGAPPHFTSVVLREGGNQLRVRLPAGRLHGLVTDRQGRPIPGARIQARRAKGSSEAAESAAHAAIARAFVGGGDSGRNRAGEDGRFVIEGVPVEEPLIVDAVADGFVAAAAPELTIGSEGGPAEVHIALERAGWIRVHVPNATGPFTFVSASFEGESAPYRSNVGGLLREGSAVLHDLAPGTWRVRQNDDDEEGGVLVDVRPGEESVVTLGP